MPLDEDDRLKIDDLEPSSEDENNSSLSDEVHSPTPHSCPLENSLDMLVEDDDDIQISNDPSEEGLDSQILDFAPTYNSSEEVDFTSEDIEILKIRILRHTLYSWLSKA